MIRGPKKSVTILLPMELYERLTALARTDNRTLSAYIRQILRQHVRRLGEFPENSDSQRCDF